MPDRQKDSTNKAPGDLTRGLSVSLSHDQQGRLGLTADHRHNYQAVFADWHDAQQRRRIAAGRRQAIARALGLHRGTRSIVDATAGLGRDAHLLASLGARVTMLERNSVVAQLLQDALSRTQSAADPAAERMQIIQQDAIHWLNQTREHMDAIYLDPMFPDSGKTALPSKEMQLLREVCGDDEDAIRLLEIARSTARRVAVKRPVKAPALGQHAPDAVIKTTQIRFDLYFNLSLRSLEFYGSRHQSNLKG